MRFSISGVYTWLVTLQCEILNLSDIAAYVYYLQSWEHIYGTSNCIQSVAVLLRTSQYVRASMNSFTSALPDHSTEDEHVARLYTANEFDKQICGSEAT